ncbi:DUF2232 domain-containing protein [Hyphomicrobium sp.]|uniref:DUF2232 domain-containing protein n=1 Tax=Hyphomicrobium sp. TaxID=82 RepID=UPI002FDD1A85
MRTPFLIGIGLGLVAAVVFASAATGPFLARFVLMFITPLPIALAGLGWGWRTAVIAGAAGSALILPFAGPAMAAAFLLTQAAPMVVLTYLAMLSRPLALESDTAPAADDGAPMEWYPPGRLVVWAAAMAGLVSAVMLVTIGGDLETLRKSLAEIMTTALEAGLPQGEGGVKLSETEITALSEIALGMLPAAFAISWMASLVFNLWLAGRVTLASGQLGRPWPNLAATAYPAGTSLAFGTALIASMLSGLPGLAASAFAGALFIAYLLLGLAVIHYTTHGRPWRTFALWALYGSLFIVNFWAAILIAMLGLAESVLHLRARFTASTGAPPSQT